MPIFDQGYQHWSGTLSGYTWRWLTITRHGVRVGMKNIFLRIVLLVSWLPAIGLGFVLSMWGLLENKSSLIAPLRPFLASFFSREMLLDPQHFRVEAWTIAYDRFLNIELYFSMIVILLVGPSLISQDLRFNALPLYFSRPLRRIDYFMGKLGVVGWFLGMVVILPSLIAYALGLLFSLDITIVRDTFPLLLACLAYGAVIVVSAGTLMLAFSSLSRNSRYVALFWIAFWFVTAIVSSILVQANMEQRRFKMFQAQANLRSVPQPQFNPQRQDQQAQQRANEDGLRKAQADFRAEVIEAETTNWRLPVSYTANLSRIGQQLLNTDATWRELGRLQPPEIRDDYVMRNMGPQYPWYWSAGVLAGLFGLSVCILNFRVRSLDRLK